jgi:hypothetical protein
MGFSIASKNASIDASFLLAECHQHKFLGMAAGLGSMMARVTRLHGDHGGQLVMVSCRIVTTTINKCLASIQTSSPECFPGRKCLAAIKRNSKTTVLQSCKRMSTEKTVYGVLCVEAFCFSFSASWCRGHWPLFLGESLSVETCVITCWKTKVWNEMEWKQMNWLIDEGWTPEYIHRERVWRHPFGSAAPLRDDPSTRRL